MTHQHSLSNQDSLSVDVSDFGGDYNCESLLLEPCIRSKKEWQPRARESLQANCHTAAHTRVSWIGGRIVVLVSLRSGRAPLLLTRPQQALLLPLLKETRNRLSYIFQ